MEQTPQRQETGSAAPPKGPDLFNLQIALTKVHQERIATAFGRYSDVLKRATAQTGEAATTRSRTTNPWAEATSYWVDAAQRTVLFWDTLRERGNNWLEHEKAGKPPLLDFDWEIVSDARKFPKPVNYALVRIVPPAGVTTDPEKRPFVVIDPRAGHGPGIGGFKIDSQVGVALKAGHPVYVVIFFPEPMPGQTLADVSRAEARFLTEIRARHPQARKPVVVGNCQGGWAAMLVGSIEPDLPGPIVVNGAPMSFWAGNDGENPMRYAGGILGGLWPALFAADLGAGQFDGAYLVENFEYLNPANTYFDKYYNLYKKIDTEPPRFLEFERWWGGFFMMNREEIRWIVENLFVGNNLAAGEAEWSPGRAFDLREIRSPIILFASLGDNITPPQQAFNWVADVYPTTEALKANGQVIVGLMHESVGHLGIFVSGAVARREHTQIVDLIDYIEDLPPGLYGMKIEEAGAVDGTKTYDVILTERRVEELQKLQKYHRKDEMPFEVVEATSRRLANAYDTFVSPLVASMATPATATVARAFNPQRLQRWTISDLNPFLAPLKTAADMTRAHRVAAPADGPFAQWERSSAAMISATWDLYRDLRDATVENLFFRAYGTARMMKGAPDAATRPAGDGAAEIRGAAQVEAALAAIEEGGRTHALVRIALLLMKAGTKRRRLSAMRRARELLGQDVGLLDLPPDTAREIIRNQSFIVEIEPERALATLPKLLPLQADIAHVLSTLDKVGASFQGNDEQIALIGRIRSLLGRRAAPVSELPVPQPGRIVAATKARPGAQARQRP